MKQKFNSEKFLNWLDDSATLKGKLAYHEDSDLNLYYYLGQFLAFRRVAEKLKKVLTGKPIKRKRGKR